MSWKLVLGMAVTLGFAWGAQFEDQAQAPKSEVHGPAVAVHSYAAGNSYVAGHALKPGKASMSDKTPPPGGDTEVGPSTADTAPWAGSWPRLEVPRSPSREVPLQESRERGELSRSKNHEEGRLEDDLKNEVKCNLKGECVGKMSNLTRGSVVNDHTDGYLLCDGCGFSTPLWWMKETREGAQGASSRVVGGEEALVGAHPWMVIVNKKCTGVLISRNWVLTAAHCLTGNRQDVWVGTGVHPYYLKDGDDRRYRFASKNYVRHPGFNGSVGCDDVGLIELRKAVTLGSSVKPVCLGGEEDLRPGLVVLAAGWGDIGTGSVSRYRSYAPSKFLQDVSLYVLPDSVCWKWGPQQPDPYKFFCAYNHGRDTCVGDSGGPLLRQEKSGRWLLVGVLSYGDVRCARRWTASVYARIPRYRSWIKKQVSCRNEC